MRNKELVLKNVESIRNKITAIKYLVNTNGSFQEISAAFEDTFAVLENMENLVSIEPDSFRTNQII